MNRTLAPLFWLFALSASVPCTGQVIRYDFEDLPTDQQTAFSYQKSGLSATFSSTGDPGGFTISPSFFDTLTGNVLLSPGTAGAGNLALQIHFNKTLSAIDLSFFTGDFDTFTSSMHLEAFSGGFNGSLVGNSDAIGAVPDFGFVPEGRFGFGMPGVSFDSIRLTVPIMLDSSGNQISATYFGVDDIDARIGAQAVPEPNASALIACAILPAYLVLRSVRRKKSQT